MAKAPKFAPISVVYYDNYNWIFTKKLVNLYRSQLNLDMLLSPDYRNKTITIIQGEHERTYSGVAISNP